MLFPRQPTQNSENTRLRPGVYQQSGATASLRSPVGMTLSSRKMGFTQRSYHKDYNPSPRQEMARVKLAPPLAGLNLEVELGSGPEETAREV
jgi:hypothetical protein